MNRLCLSGFKLWIPTFSVFSLTLLFSFNCIAQPSYDTNVDICKKLAIESAQLANQSYLYAQKSYFNPAQVPDKNVDTALIFIQESIFLMDSAIILASDSSVLAIKYANIAKNYAIDSYNDLIYHKNSRNNYQKNELSKSATFNSANATVEAYKASFYFKDKKKTVLPHSITTPNKQITKLDIDQTLFTILKEDLQQKKEMNTREISKLSEELSKTNEPLKQAELKAQLEKLTEKEKEFNKKNNDTQQKLTSINSLIEERDKDASANLKNEETVFSKSIINTTDEWNNQVKLVVELPVGLVYQVQLGVYKNSIVPEVFKGLTPIYGKTTEKGISYATGLFEKLADAREAKNYVIQMGFTDAFIVAYNHKKQIPLEDAVKLEK